MKRDYRKWHSPAVERDMEMLVFGEAGTPVVVYPTSMGRFYQWEDFGMIDHLRSRIEDGWLQLWCVDSIDAESFYAKTKPWTERATRALAYERYVVDEVMPTIRGENPVDFLVAAGASFGLGLSLRAMKAPVLHQGNGFIDFGPAGSSYYYSRTRLSANGELQLNGETLKVTGIAWFDHQWGDFVSVGAGGWDWFAINLDDGTDITVSVVRDEHASPLLQYGTLVRPSGEVVDLHASSDELTVGPGAGTWESPRTGVAYSTSWGIKVGDLDVELAPTVTDQELDTRATTGVVYWEGSQVVTGTRGDQPIAGRAYVEITRYDTPRG